VSISGSRRKEIIRRAGNRCEYCQLSQAGQEAAFHIDHIHPVSDGGVTELGNLALACVSCSLRKAAKRHGFDHLTGRAAALSIHGSKSGRTILHGMVHASAAKHPLEGRASICSK